MALTDIYRKQHDELLNMAGTLAGKLNASGLREKPEEAVSLLAQFAAKLNVHLSMEDRALYPKLKDASDPNCAKTAKEFQEEMGGIKKFFEDYAGKWSNSAEIRTNPDDFITQTQGLISALGQRIDKENTVLYPLADAL